MISYRCIYTHWSVFLITVNDVVCTNIILLLFTTHYATLSGCGWVAQWHDSVEGVVTGLGSVISDWNGVETRFWRMQPGLSPGCIGMAVLWIVGKWGAGGWLLGDTALCVSCCASAIVPLCQLRLASWVKRRSRKGDKVENTPSVVASCSAS